MLTRRKMLAGSAAALPLAIVGGTATAAEACEMPIDPREKLLDMVDELCVQMDTVFPGKVRWWGFGLPGTKEGRKDRGFAFMFDRDDAFEFRKDVFEAAFPLSALVVRAENHMRKLQEYCARADYTDEKAEWYDTRFFAACDRVLGYVPRNFEETRDKMRFLSKVSREMGRGYWDASECDWLIASFVGRPGTIVSRKAVQA